MIERSQKQRQRQFGQIRSTSLTEERLSVLCVLVEGNGSLHVQLTVEKVDDVAFLSVLLHEFGGNYLEFVSLWYLMIQLAECADGEIAGDYVHLAFLLGGDARILLQEIPDRTIPRPAPG